MSWSFSGTSPPASTWTWPHSQTGPFHWSGSRRPALSSLWQPPEPRGCRGRRGELRGRRGEPRGRRGGRRGARDVPLRSARSGCACAGRGWRTGGPDSLCPGWLKQKESDTYSAAFTWGGFHKRQNDGIFTVKLTPAVWPWSGVSQRNDGSLLAMAFPCLRAAEQCQYSFTKSLHSTSSILWNFTYVVTWRVELRSDSILVYDKRVTALSEEIFRYFERLHFQMEVASSIAMPIITSFIVIKPTNQGIISHGNTLESIFS